MQVEMLFALDNGSWFSDIRSVPDAAVNADFASGQWDAEVIDWVTTHACPQDCVLVAVYNSDPQEEQRTADDFSFEMHVSEDDDPDISFLEQEEFADRLEEYKNDGFDFVGIRATTRIDGSVYSSPGLWGIESDSGEEYFQEVFEEEKAMLIDELVNAGLIATTEEKAA